jgi:hypothetical protein
VERLQQLPKPLQQNKEKIMALKKIGSPEKIRVMKEGEFSFDPNLIVKEIQKKWPNSEISVDQVHEAVKSLGIINYNSEDMNEVLRLLDSVGIAVKS